MKQMRIILFLIISSSYVFGQNVLSNDALYFIKNEKEFSKKASEIIKNILKEDNLKLNTDKYYFKIIPTFQIKKKYLNSDTDVFLQNIKIDKSVLFREIIAINKPVIDFKYYVGYSFCDGNNCNFYLYFNSPEWHEKYEKATEKFIFERNYDFIFKIDNYPDFWFLLKGNQLSLYSFLNETLYSDKSELQKYVKTHIPRIGNRSYIKIPTIEEDLFFFPQKIEQK